MIIRLIPVTLIQLQCSMHTLVDQIELLNVAGGTVFEHCSV